MKKLFISLAAVMCMASAVSAQTLIVVEEKPVLTNKRGVRILPQAGEMSIGISATPFLTYFGNMFTRDGVNDAPTFLSNGTGINFKFFTTDNQAIRAGLIANFGKNYYYGTPQSNADAATTVTDRMRTTSQQFGINLGYEWRMGMGRLQGFMGVQLNAGYTRMLNEYEYGNVMDADFPNPWTWNFNTNNQAQVASRTLSAKSSANITVGLSGFVGVEYFFAPKMSVGGEIGLGVYYVNQGKTEFETQTWNSTTNVAEINKEERHDPRIPADGFGVRTSTQGNIFFNFYF